MLGQNGNDESLSDVVESDKDDVEGSYTKKRRAKQNRKPKTKKFTPSYPHLSTLHEIHGRLSPGDADKIFGIHRHMDDPEFKVDDAIDDVELILDNLSGYPEDEGAMRLPTIAYGYDLAVIESLIISRSGRLLELLKDGIAEPNFLPPASAEKFKSWLNVLPNADVFNKVLTAALQKHVQEESSRRRLNQIAKEKRALLQPVQQTEEEDNGQQWYTDNEEMKEQFSQTPAEVIQNRLDADKDRFEEDEIEPAIVREALSAVYEFKSSGYDGNPRRQPTRIINIINAFRNRESEPVLLDDIAQGFSETTEPRKSAASAMSWLGKIFEKLDIDVEIETQRFTTYQFRRRT